MYTYCPDQAVFNEISAFHGLPSSTPRVEDYYLLIRGAFIIGCALSYMYQDKPLWPISQHRLVCCVRDTHRCPRASIPRLPFAGVRTDYRREVVTLNKPSSNNQIFADLVWLGLAWNKGRQCYLHKSVSMVTMIVISYWWYLYEKLKTMANLVLDAIINKWNLV